MRPSVQVRGLRAAIKQLQTQLGDVETGKAPLSAVNQALAKATATRRDKWDLSIYSMWRIFNCEEPCKVFPRTLAAFEAGYAKLMGASPKLRSTATPTGRRERCVGTSRIRSRR